jgi:hypothetical protein
MNLGHRIVASLAAVPKCVALRGPGILGLAILFVLSLTSTGAGNTVREHDVKAAFLLNFARFVEWPAEAFSSSNAPLVVGVMGESPFGDALQRTLSQQTARGRPITLRTISENEDGSQCHLLFVSQNLAPSYEQILNRLRKAPVLTVGETTPFAKQGGIIEFNRVNDSVRFDINAVAAESAGLRFSSKLLAVARTVLRSP